MTQTARTVNLDAKFAGTRTLPVLAPPADPLNLAVHQALPYSSKQRDRHWDLYGEPDRRHNILDKLEDRDFLICTLPSEESWPQLRDAIGAGSCSPDADLTRFVAGIPQLDGTIAIILPADLADFAPSTPRAFGADSADAQLRLLLANHDRSKRIMVGGSLRVSERREDVREQRKRKVVGEVVDTSLEELETICDGLGVKCSRWSGEVEGLTIWLHQTNINLAKLLANRLGIQFRRPDYLDKAYETPGLGREPPDLAA